jgi:hypothetical protein
MLVSTSRCRGLLSALQPRRAHNTDGAGWLQALLCFFVALSTPEERAAIAAAGMPSTNTQLQGLASPPIRATPGVVRPPINGISCSIVRARMALGLSLHSRG